MSETLHLELPLIAGAQSQKHVTHNEALAIVDHLVHLAVISRVLSTPPSSPLDGDRYLIAAGATGVWSTHDGELAFYLDGAWRFALPRTGWRLWSVAEEELLVFDGSLWRDVQDIDELQNVELVGINTTADAANRLAVASANILFTHDGGDQRIKINKNTAADTASILLQTNFGGRAEIGTTGDDDFHFKVSPDGSAWTDAIVIDKDDGHARFAGGGISIGGQGDPATNARIYMRQAPGVVNNFNAVGDGANAQFVFDMFNNTLGASAIYRMRRARGSFASPFFPNTNSLLGSVRWALYDGIATVDAVTLGVTAIGASPGTSDAECRLSCSMAPINSATLAEMFRFDHATGFSMFGANPVINEKRHFRKRQYAAGSLPAQNAGDEIASSDIVAATLVSDGTEWLSPGIKRLRNVTAAATVSIPAGWAIDQIFFAETAGNAVTGGIKIGTTSGATDVVAAQAVSANALDVIADAAILKKAFSRSAAQTLHIQAVTAWNGASVDLSFVLGKVF